MLVLMAETDHAYRISIGPWSKALTDAGETVEVLVEHSPGEPFHDAPVQDITQFAMHDYRVRNGTEPGYGLFRETAQRWYGTYADKLSSLGKVEALLTIGSSQLKTRAAICAAQALQIPVICVEWGCFPHKFGANVGSIVTRDRAYYAQSFTEHLRWFIKNWSGYDEKRILAYKDQWLKAKDTKHGSAVRLDVPLPESWTSAKERILWLSQVPHDASMYWTVEAGRGARLFEDIQKVGGFVKRHPKDFGRSGADFWTGGGGGAWEDGTHILPTSASIHSLLPQCDAVVVHTSGTGLEAWMYDLPVATYGGPMYAGPGLTVRSIGELDLWFNPRLRLRFLDYLIHVMHVYPSNGRAFARRIHALLGREEL